MVNHARTLLLNREGANEAPGSQYVSPAFRALTLPSYLQTIRGRLFGSRPDAAMLNYRLAQYMALLHSTELSGYVTSLDERMTYREVSRYDLYVPTTYTPSVQQLTGTLALPAVVGAPVAPEPEGRMSYAFHLERTGSDELMVVQEAPEFQKRFLDLVFTDGLSAPVALGASGYSVQILQTAVNSTWRITFCNRPAWDLGQIAEALAVLGEPILLSLFGTGAAEPYTTFRNLWQTHSELAYRLGGFLLAVIWRTEEIRQGGA